MQLDITTLDSMNFYLVGIPTYTITIVGIPTYTITIVGIPTYNRAFT